MSETKPPETISLCIIAGNESAHIVRLLESFGPGFDELSLVLALGSQTPDDTAALAREWCTKNGKKLKLGTYRNAPETSAWAHIDDFAAARNLSFSQASGTWLVWADCDDTCEDAASLRTLAASDRADMFRLPYRVPDAHKLTTRERLIRADLFRAGRVWRWPVHENLLVFEGDRWENAPAPAWVHAPAGPKAGGDKRNLRILTQSLRDAPTNYYYAHQEHFHLRNTAIARRFGQIFLSLPQRSPALEYQCLLNMAELSEMKEEATTYALRAHQLYPQQKEALAILVRASFQAENAAAALQWSKLLVEKAPPPLGERLWCYEPKWEGWHGYDLRARAFRYAGLNDAARFADAEARAGRAIELSLLHATRGRPSRAIACREIWMDLADDPASIEHLFAIDDDDAESLRWLKSFAHVVNPGRTCVTAWNLAADQSCGRVLIQLSDDWTPPRGWDTKLRAAYAGRDPTSDSFVIAVSDGNRDDRLLCMAILSRARWHAQEGEVFSPAYESVFSDDEFTHRAYRDGVVIEARDFVFKHHHPAFGHGKEDATYRRQNAPEKYERGKKTFRERNPDAPAEPDYAAYVVEGLP